VAVTRCHLRERTGRPADDLSDDRQRDLEQLGLFVSGESVTRIIVLREHLDSRLDARPEPKVFRAASSAAILLWMFAR
jgi:hypothetical protein